MTRKDSVSMVIPQLCNVSLFCSQMQIYVAIFKLKKKKQQNQQIWQLQVQRLFKYWIK